MVFKHRFAFAFLTFVVAFGCNRPTRQSSSTTDSPSSSSSPASVNLVVATSPATAKTSVAITRTLYTFPESDKSVTPLYALVNSAKKSVDMTMYELQDTVFSGDLVALCKSGVRVRVILSSSEKPDNTPAYTQLNGAGSSCSAVYSNTAFTNTHEKSFVVDGSQASIMSLNLQTQYYSTSRDFALVENDPSDIAAIEATFNADYAAGTPNSGKHGASDFSYQPGVGDDLIWSPTTAQADMLALINNATKTLMLENEEMSAPNIVSALETACKTRHVAVEITMASSSSYATEFAALVAAGCGVHVYPATATGLYIHAKAVVADYGLSTQNAYMGSINYSTASLTKNRELGLYVTDSSVVQSIYSTLISDYAGGTPY